MFLCPYKRLSIYFRSTAETVEDVSLVHTFFAWNVCSEEVLEWKTISPRHFLQSLLKRAGHTAVNNGHFGSSLAVPVHCRGYAIGVEEKASLTTSLLYLLRSYRECHQASRVIF